MKTEMKYEKSTENKVLAYCRRTGMFQNGDKVVLGVSGGADSICLLFMLLKFRESLGIRLYVVHVNHGVREDAGEDAAYVESLCRQYDIPFMLEEIRLDELAQKLGATQEEAGRMARYEAFEKACEKFGCTKIAVAHNSNDRAETMLFHLFRGTGLKGMAGILPIRDNVVRPLLCLERGEIEEYLRKRGILYKQDSTNATDAYTRNRIRHHILPYAEQWVAAGCVRNLCRAGDIFAEEEVYLEELTYEALDACISHSIAGDENTLNTVELSVPAFQKQHPVMQKRLLWLLLRQLSPGQQDITAGHVEDIRTLFQIQENRQIHLPYQIRGERIYDKVRLQRQIHLPKKEEGYDILLPILNNVGDEHQVILPDGSKFRFVLLERPEKLSEYQVFFENIYENRYTKWFDYDTMVRQLRVRTRQTGDYLTIRREDTLCHKKLKDYMITEKIPKEEREKIPVIAEDSHVLWLAGYRISEHYKVSINTKKILQVQWIR